MSEIKWYNCNNFAQGNSSIKHAFFTKKGGISQGIYSSCNFGYGSNDDKINIDENRNRAIQSWQSLDKSQLITLSQIHSNKVIYVDEKLEGHQRTINADAMVTDKKNIALGILTADCTPVLFADYSKNIIGAAHAGWSGAFKGICLNVIKEMVKLGATEQNIEIAIGPTIQQESYEVGQEFFDRFINQSSNNKEFFIPSTKDEHYLFDLPGYITKQIQAETKISNIFNTSIDTYRNDEELFSYRRSCHRGEDGYGRNLSVVMCA